MKLSQDQVNSIYVRVTVSPGQEIVLLDVGGRKDIPETESNRNIYRIASDYSVVWQVDAPPSPHGRDSFVSLEYTDGVLRADRFFGREYLVDKDSGVAQEIGWHK